MEVAELKKENFYLKNVILQVQSQQGKEERFGMGVNINGGSFKSGLSNKAPSLNFPCMTVPYLHYYNP